MSCSRGRGGIRAVNARPSVLGLDLGVKLGVAYGIPATVPHSTSLRLKGSEQPPAAAFAALRTSLKRLLQEYRIGLVVKEAPIALEAFARLANSEATVRTTYGYHAIVEEACEVAGIPCHEVPVITVRKHFLGRGTFEDRETAKAAVVRRCQLLRYLPRDCEDTDRADACAVWDW